MQPLRVLLCSLVLLLAVSCRTRHEVSTTSTVAPIEIKPIHITIDINLKVDKALDDFFGDIDRAR
jgi:hypothetical protein